jgi:hypothetical protein
MDLGQKIERARERRRGEDEDEGCEGEEKRSTSGQV